MESRVTCWRFFAPSQVICRTLYKQGNHLQWILLFIFFWGVLVAGLPTEGLSHEAEITPRRMTDLESLSVLEKIKLVDAYMRHTVFEVHVSRVPALLPLFKAFEKQTKHKFRGIKMSDFDESCQRYYEDSASMRGDFDRDFYEAAEDAAPGAEGIRCLYDGKGESIYAFLRRRKRLMQHKPLPTLGKLARGFYMPLIEAAPLENLYGDILLNKLNLTGRLGPFDYKSLVSIKNFVYMPPEGFLQWHTNKNDNIKVSYRMYMLLVDEDGGSSFKYLTEHDGKVMKVPDFHGAVRLFTNTFVDKAGVRTNLWHTVVSETAHRFSIGFEMPPKQMVALLDSCDGCWEEILWGNWKSVAADGHS